MKLRNIATIYLLYKDKILLMYRVGSRLFKEPIWVGVGGHFENSEMNDPEKCILRELFEETGLDENKIRDLRLKYITTRKLSDEIRQQYIFFAETDSDEITFESDEGKLEWLRNDSVQALKMAFTNEQCLNHYFSTGKNDTEIYTCSLDLVDDKPHMNFTCLREVTFSY